MTFSSENKKYRKTIINPSKLDVYNTFFQTELLERLVLKGILTQQDSFDILQKAQMKTWKWKPNTSGKI